MTTNEGGSTTAIRYRDLRTTSTAGFRLTSDAPLPRAVTDPAPTYLSPADVAELLSLHVKVIHRAVRDGELAAFKVRNRIRISRADLDAWLEASRVRPVYSTGADLWP
jgi:excisionase family DNA binding protein